MIVLVCGGRLYRDQGYLFAELDSRMRMISSIVTGGGGGADTLAIRWAVSRGIPSRNYYADWKSYGKAAGPIRNAYMLKRERPGLVLAFPGGPGTCHMVKIAREAGVKVECLGWYPAESAP